MSTETPPVFRIEPATERDVALVLTFIKELAAYEKLADQVIATVDDLRKALFGPDRVAQALIAYASDEPAGFAVYFFSFSTFVGRPGLYLEDLYVRPAWRKQRLGRKLMAHLAGLAVARNCDRMSWMVLNWNETALRLYRAIGARPMSEWTVQRVSGADLAALAEDA